MPAEDLITRDLLGKSPVRGKEGGGDWVHDQTPKQWNKKGREELREKT